MTETGKDEYTSDEVVVYGEQLYSERPSQESVELDTLSSGTGSMADADLIITKEDGANAWVKKTASKLWDYIKGKIGISNGGSANKFLNEQGTFTVVNSGKVYDVEMSSDLDEMTLTEDGTDKTTLPLVATFVGTRADWNNLSAAEKAKYLTMDFTDDGGFGDISDEDVTFTSSDVVDADANSWTVVSPIASGTTLNTLFSRVSQMFKNVRYLYNKFNNGFNYSYVDKTISFTANAGWTNNINLGVTLSKGTWLCFILTTMNAVGDCQMGFNLTHFLATAMDKYNGNTPGFSVATTGQFTQNTSILCSIWTTKNQSNLSITFRFLRIGDTA